MVAGYGPADVLEVVQQFIEVSAKFDRWAGLELESAIVVSTGYNRATGGENVRIVASQTAPGTELAVLSQSWPLYDWGRNRRNLNLIAGGLRQAGMTIDEGPMTSRHRLGGPRAEEIGPADRRRRYPRRR